MRLNKQDGGYRQCISVTNNEVAADEQKNCDNRAFAPEILTGKIGAFVTT